MNPAGYSYDKQLAADLQALRISRMYNLTILAAIVICTVSVAYLAQSAAGLWSMLLLFVWQIGHTNLGAPPPPHREDDDFEDLAPISGRR